MPRSTGWIANALLVVGSVIVALAALELATRLVWTKPTTPYFAVLPGELRLAPGSETTYRTDEFAFTVEANRFGRRDTEWTAEAIADPCNLLFVGDSFVFGYGVEENETLPSRLEEAIARAGPRREVFNYGLTGGLRDYRDLALAALDRDGIRARTMLVGVFLGNDFVDEAIARPPADDRPIVGVRLNESVFFQFLKYRVSASPRLTGAAFRLAGWLGRDVYISNTGYIFLRDWTPAQAAVFERYLDRLSGLDTLGRERERRVTFVLLPNLVQVENAEALSGGLYDAAAPNRRVLDSCESRGLSCVDLLPALQAAYRTSGRSLFFRHDRHMNAEGNRVAAAALADRLGTGACAAPR